MGVEQGGVTLGRRHGSSRRLRPREAGQSTAEFALLIPAIVLVTLLVMQAAVIAAASVRLVGTCRNAARILIVEPSLSEAEIRDRVSAPPSVGFSVRAENEFLGRGSVRCVHTVPTEVALVGRAVPDVLLRERLSFLVEGPLG